LASLVTVAVIPTLVLIAAAAVLAPIISEQTRGLRVPSVVIELGLGILIGPDVLKLTHPNEVISALSDMRLTFLMFLAGFELDLNRVKGNHSGWHRWAGSCRSPWRSGSPLPWYRPGWFSIPS
jgi:Kef-type K+ transport system membrane component KefB